MLKFAHKRSSSAERPSVMRSAPVPQFQRTNTREFSPARRHSALVLPPIQNSPTRDATPRSSRTSSLERVPMRSRRQLNFEEASLSPLVRRRMLPPSGSPPPVIRTANVKRSVVSSASPPTPGSRIPVLKVPVSQLSEEDSAESLPRPAVRGAIFAPKTPTLEKLSNPHVIDGVKRVPGPKSVLKKPLAKYDFHTAVEKLVEKLDLQLQLDTSSESGYGSDDHDSLGSRGSRASTSSNGSQESTEAPPPPLPRRRSVPTGKRRVKFDSYVLLLQGIRERNLELVQTHVKEVCKEALATDEVMLEFMRAVIEGGRVPTTELLVRELLAAGVDPNFTDPAGLTPLHLAAAFNALPVIKTLLNHGAAIFVRAHSSGKTPSEMLAPQAPNFQACNAYLRCMEECLGVANDGRVFVALPYRTCRADELIVQPGDEVLVLKKGDYAGSSWWWGRNHSGQEGYVLKDLLALNKSKLLR